MKVYKYNSAIVGAEVLRWVTVFALPLLQLRVDLIGLRKLREHEEVDPRHLRRLKAQIRADGVLKRPIVVDRKTRVILDGEHRFNALKQLGCTQIPIVFVDYDSPSIGVKAWRKGEHVTKEAVIEAGVTGRKLSFKTSRHMIRLGSRLNHISVLQGRVDIPLERLRRHVGGCRK